MENWRRNETPVTLSMAVTPMFAVRIGIWSGAFCRGEGGGGHNPKKNSQSNEREPAINSTTCDISSGNRTQTTASAYNAALSLVPAPLLQGSTG